ncbi:hypothetical protein MVEN_01508800 [Mycena venus]|uniref:Uncharacterized protein n=1 Tax=Mycena venus TaxID=2733690 RepID=A0A8H6XW81_9AGAR|nr:hypothetical protein MVEN_01508800 [Mycena venus]
MSSDKENANTADKPNASGASPAQLNASIEADIAELNELLSKETLDDSEEASVAELLARLESADGVAKGVESKLDALLGNLDSLLAVLEEKEKTDEVENAQQPRSSQSTDKKSTDKS